MNENLTTEQKIDMIYEKMIARERREKTGLMVKWGFRVFFLLYLFYFLFFGLPKMMDNLKTTITPDISGITLPEGSLEKISELLNR